ncbi:ComF family protein [Arthrobacter sp.]|uniref:ComF family protein n=1 Tax=Arthrobacter sp. TaxID=1667 RepID=UPI0026DF4BB3|nr:phosphoribosyltransferase family protein [Arthrobacter sp.]MDO5751428.1 phosphoribosyltransferase family protein [Arthrobacter sp.]
MNNGDADAGSSGAEVPIRPWQRARHRERPRSPWLQLWNWCETAWLDFLNLVMPAECVGCGAEDQTLCQECATVLRRLTCSPFRAELAAEALVGVAGESHLPVVAAGEYRDALASGILAFKNHGRTELCLPLGRVLARALTAALAELPGRSPLSGSSLWLVPIPSTGSGWRRRGYDPVAMILRALVREGRMPEGVEIVPVLAVRARLPWNRKHQKALGRAGRRRNVHNTRRNRRRSWGSTRLKANPRGQLVLLVDDVLTTGATLREGAKTLTESGFRVCGAVVLAAARAPEKCHENDDEKGRAENSFRSKGE